MHYFERVVDGRFYRVVQWADTSLQLHTFATVLDLTLVALAKLAFGRK